MSRNTQYQFVSTDTDTLVSDLVSAYEQMTGISVQPSSPEKLFISWVSNIILQERVMNNFTGNQNLPSRAEGENLDALGELFYAVERPGAQPATCTMRFYISESQSVSVLVPKGTRITDSSNTLIWETVSDAFVNPGTTSVDVGARCQTSGDVGNGYAKGQINTIVDVYDYYEKCENITTSDGGADMATDDEYYEILRLSQDAYSTAGPYGGYIYFAKRASLQIADVVANSPQPGQVAIYALMEDGTAAGEEVKHAVLAACSADSVRPLTDRVTVEDPEPVTYDISFTYYLSRDGAMSADEMQQLVDAAVQEYVLWQAGKLGRDINPSYLVGLLMQTGIKRVDLVSPSFVSLRNGGDNTVPQMAKLGETTVQNGGYEDD